MLVSCLTFCKSEVHSCGVRYSSYCLSAHLILFGQVANDWCESDWCCVLQCSAKLCHFKSAFSQAQTSYFWNTKACMCCLYIAILLMKSGKKITKLEVPSGISRWVSYMKEYIVVCGIVIDGQVSGFTVVCFTVIAVVKLTKNVKLWKIYICLWQEGAIIMYVWLRLHVVTKRLLFLCSLANLFSYDLKVAKWLVHSEAVTFSHFKHFHSYVDGIHYSIMLLWYCAETVQLSCSLIFGFNLWCSCGIIRICNNLFRYVI
jgi:hypothetical protein